MILLMSKILLNKYFQTFYKKEHKYYSSIKKKKMKKSKNNKKFYNLKNLTMKIVHKKTSKNLLKSKNKMKFLKFNKNNNNKINPIKIKFKQIKVVKI